MVRFSQGIHRRSGSGNGDQTLHARMRYIIPRGDKGGKGKIVNAMKRKISRGLHGRLAKLGQARVGTAARPMEQVLPRVTPAGSSHLLFYLAYRET